MSKISRRKFSSAFKSKVCIEAIKEQQAVVAQLQARIDAAGL